MLDGGRWQAPAVDEEVIASSPGVVFVRERNWSLIAAVCVLGVLLAAASVISVQQHNVADKWMRQYHAEVNDNRAEVQKNVGLYSSLVLAQQRFSTCVNDANRVLFDIDIYFRDGFLPTSSKSDVMTAGQTCQTRSGTGP
jgi:hypothetical protein